MRHGLSNRRHRNRSTNNNNTGGGNNATHNRRPQNSRTQVYDSNGPDVRIRGTAHQVNEKYMLLAKDAASAGDRVLSESYLQHAEHYQRIINSWEAEAPVRPAARLMDEDVDNSAQLVDKAVDIQDAEDDLMLPASILGTVPKASHDDESEERTEYSRSMSVSEA